MLSEERDFPMKPSHYPRHSGILSPGSHTMPNTPGTWQQQAQEHGTAEERGLLEAIPLQRVPIVALLSGGLRLISSTADCSSSGRATKQSTAWSLPTRWVPGPETWKDNSEPFSLGFKAWELGAPSAEADWWLSSKANMAGLVKTEKRWAWWGC